LGTLQTSLGGPCNETFCQRPQQLVAVFNKFIVELVYIEWLVAYAKKGASQQGVTNLVFANEFRAVTVAIAPTTKE
jgi:hypothetical protein